MQFVIFLTVLALLLPERTSAASQGTDPPVQVGLYYGSSSSAVFNLENVEGCGNGYQFGYFDSDLTFIPLGSTSETKVSILKTHNLYLTNSNEYTTSVTSNGVVGCYHVQLPGEFRDYASAKALADLHDGFVALVGGTYYARVGSYISSSAASAAASSYGGIVGETSAYGISLTITGTDTILFQIDDLGEGSGLGVRPGLDSSIQTQTWCKGTKYYGSFRYERVNGGDLTVVNVVDMDEYISCVIAEEMGDSWPLESLKAQAICARNFYASAHGRHTGYHFNVCSGTHCQVYRGTGGTGSNTELAAKSTSGEYLWYEDELVEAYYFSSDGGATESSGNVWSTDLPYLQGIMDPYEDSLSQSIPGYQWSYSLTGEELRAKLAASGRTGCSTITSISLTSSDTGNVYSITFHDANGKDWSLYRESCRTILGFPSMRFTLGSGGVKSNRNLSASNLLSSSTEQSGLFAIDGNGQITSVEEPVYIITDSGTQILEDNTPSSPPSNTPPPSTSETPAPSTSPSRPENPGSKTVSASGSPFRFSGSGNGHNVGMSQWGARALALLGYDYRSILTFYYTGVTLK